MYFVHCVWYLVLIAIASYLIGGVNFSIIISKLKKHDIRKEGSGNPGTLNMSRTFGLKTGLLILLLDISKGLVPTLIARLAFGDLTFAGADFKVYYLSEYVAGFFVVLGHIFPVYFKFKGGKGIATTIGVFLATQWYIAIIFGIVAIAFILMTKIGSMGSFLATTPPAIFACIDLYNQVDLAGRNPYMLTYYIGVNMLVLGIIVLTWYAHRKNIERLVSGDEHATDWLQMIKDTKLKKIRAEKTETLGGENDKDLCADKTENRTEKTDALTK